MTDLCKILFAGVVLLVVIACALHPAAQPLAHNPLACLGVGLIGLGLMKSARERLAVCAATR